MVFTRHIPSLQVKYQSSAPGELYEKIPVEHFGLSQATLSALKSRGIETLLPIQAATFPELSKGNDVVGRAKTGTGKTLAFAIPIVERILKKRQPARSCEPYALILLPTRELAQQVCDEVKSLSREVRIFSFYGGSPMEPQIQALRRGVDVVVGTPGRILDHIERQGTLVFNSIEMVVLDEADRMLDMGFSKDIEKIMGYVKAGNNPYQTMLFSATLPVWIKSIIAGYLQPKHAVIDLVGEEDSQINLNCRHVAIMCSRSEQTGALVAAVLEKYSSTKALIFCTRKAEVPRLAADGSLRRAAAGRICMLHGDMSQHRRNSTMQTFKRDPRSVLVATDVAARGIDVSGVDLVVMTEPPTNVEDYIHRSGRTARGDAKGTCVTLFRNGNGHLMRRIEQRIKTKMDTEHLGETHSDEFGDYGSGYDDYQNSYDRGGRRGYNNRDHGYGSRGGRLGYRSNRARSERDHI